MQLYVVDSRGHGMIELFGIIAVVVAGVVAAAFVVAAYMVRGER